MWPFLSLERDGRCATTFMSAGQTSGCPKVLLLCWTSVSMYFREGRRQSRAWAPVGRGLQGVPLWLCTAVPALAAQVNACTIVGFEYTFTIHLVVTSLDVFMFVQRHSVFESCGFVLAYRGGVTVKHNNLVGLGIIVQYYWQYLPVQYPSFGFATNPFF